MALAQGSEAAVYGGCRAPSAAKFGREWTWRLPAALIRLLRAWRRQAAERRYLAGLSDRDLRDMGLSRHDVALPPPTWFR